MAAGVLSGLSVLVTRPAERAEGLVAAIAARGGRPLHCPAVVIEPLPPAADPADPARYAAMLFVSPAAVSHGVAALGLTPGTAPALGAIGATTARTLREQGFAVTIGPAASQDSEGLLRAPALARERVEGQRILIVRGTGGREALAGGLMARGASVTYAEVYRRRRPETMDGALAASADIVTVTSNECLENLLHSLDAGQRARLLDRPVAAAGSRVCAAVRQAGFRNQVLGATGADDASLVEAVVQLAPAARGAAEPE